MAGNGISSVEAARRRAIVSAFLQNNRGPQTIEVIAEHLGGGVTNRSVAQILNGLSRAGLISPPVKIKGKGKGYAWKGSENGAAGAPVAAQAAKRTTATSDVELVFGDTLIVLGRNKSTGRIRITIEDVKP